MADADSFRKTQIIVKMWVVGSGRLEVGSGQSAVGSNLS
jgi:hypothetical protein